MEHVRDSSFVFFKLFLVFLVVSFHFCIFEKKKHMSLFFRASIDLKENKRKENRFDENKIRICFSTYWFCILSLDSETHICLVRCFFRIAMIIAIIISG
jgi:hypothetical protein